MSPDDPRHGTNKGYNAGCRELCCKAAHAAYRKANRNGRTGHYIDARGTHRRLQALGALGHSLADLSRACGRCDSWAVWVLRCPRVHTGTAALVTDLYERLSMQVPDGPTSGRERRTALSKGWVPPLAWDDIDLDDAPAAPEPLGDEFVDEVALQRAWNGQRVALNRAEREELLARWDAAGRARNEFERVLGIVPGNAKRYVRESA